MSSMNVSLMKASLSGALTYGMFSYALPNEPNKTYFTIGSAVGSYLGDSIISIIMPTYTPTGTLMDTMISSASSPGILAMPEIRLLAECIVFVKKPPTPVLLNQDIPEPIPLIAELNVFVIPEPIELKNDAIYILYNLIF